MHRLGLFLIFCFCLGSATALGSGVTISHQWITLNGNLELAEGKSLKDGAVLITHGTLTGAGQEIDHVRQGRRHA